MDLDISDSATGLPIVTLKIVDITGEQTARDSLFLLYGEAVRGRLVQIRSDAVQAHYFYGETTGAQMIFEDGDRWGFEPIMLLGLIQMHAPMK